MTHGKSGCHVVEYTNHKRWMPLLRDENWGMIKVVKSEVEGMFKCEPSLLQLRFPLATFLVFILCPG